MKRYLVPKIKDGASISGATVITVHDDGSITLCPFEKELPSTSYLEDEYEILRDSQGRIISFVKV